HGPRRAAITGNGAGWTAAIARWSAVMGRFGRGPSGPRSRRASMPAVNARPAPVSTATRTEGSRASASNVARRARINRGSSRLSGGRSSAHQTTEPSRSTPSPAVMARVEHTRFGPRASVSSRPAGEGTRRRGRRRARQRRACSPRPFAILKAVTDPTRLLSGVTVLDLTRVLAGPYCTRLLADLGARVIKVERPGEGDEMRRAFRLLDADRDDQSTYFVRVNTGKLSVAIDLGHPEARGVVLDLARAADVVVEHFLPGVAQRLGCDYAQLAAA